MGNVSGIIKAIQDIMRKDAGVDGDAQRISQLVWMFFLKILDDREAELEILDDSDEFQSPIPEHLRWRTWAANAEGITGDALLDFVNSQLFPALQNKMPVQGEVGKRGQIIRDVFEDTYNYMKSGTLMRQVVNKINEIDFNSSDDRHTFGDIYEQILKDLQSAGNAGEFYTPRAVTELIVDRVNPRLGEKIFDPACGTGGFLVNAIEHIREQDIKSSADEVALAKSIQGVEKKPLPFMLCVTNAILHGVDTPTGIRHDNTLTRPYKDYSDKDRVDVIITNPPFGGMEEDGIENNFPTNYRTRETADLFMALIIKLLRKHGRAAVVLPDGFFFGEGVKTRLKEALITECNLHTIVRLPNSVFAPYTSIKTNILFFTKGEPTTDIWFYEHKLPHGVKAYNKTKPMQFKEFKPLIDWWGEEANGFKARKETEKAWKVFVEEIEKRGYNLDLDNPNTKEARKRKPQEILPEFEDAQEKITSIQAELKSNLSEALIK